jgi:tRNA (guanine37-N1)-methyltransferase
MTHNPSRTFVALVHHPVYDRNGRVVATALTNLDLHDMARACRTYGLAGLLIVHPVEAQRTLAARIADHWRDHGEELNNFRRMAIERVTVVETLASARDHVAQACGEAPLLCATSARPLEGALSFSALPHDRPLLLVFGTGWGLADEALALCPARLAPVRGAGDYNHLSVRSACAIILDRLYGDRQNYDPFER